VIIRSVEEKSSFHFLFSGFRRFLRCVGTVTPRCYVSITLQVYVEHSHPHPIDCQLPSRTYIIFNCAKTSFSITPSRLFLLVVTFHGISPSMQSIMIVHEGVAHISLYVLRSINLNVSVFQSGVKFIVF
jgi:hypothetical protein